MVLWVDNISLDKWEGKWNPTKGTSGKICKKQEHTQVCNKLKDQFTLMIKEELVTD